MRPPSECDASSFEVMKEDATEWDTFSFGATKEYTAEEDALCSDTMEQDASYSDARGRHGGGRHGEERVPLLRHDGLGRVLLCHDKGGYNGAGRILLRND